MAQVPFDDYVPIMDTVYGDLAVRTWDVNVWPDGDYVETGMEVVFALITSYERTDATVVWGTDPALPGRVYMKCDPLVVQGHVLMVWGTGR